MRGIITKGVKGIFTVYITDGEYRCKAIPCTSRGVFRKDSIRIKPLVGDNVEVELNLENRVDDETVGVITKIDERKNMLKRPNIANVDMLFVVAAADQPAPDLYFIDKLTASAHYLEIEPVIVFTKTDLKNAEDLINIYDKAGIKCFTIDNTDASSETYDTLKSMMANNICVFAGMSGVGKSTLLNRLLPGLSQETGVLSERIERGKHTTRITELFSIGESGFIADTPGFSRLDFDGEEQFTKNNLVFGFPDILIYSTNCKFSKCTHIKEQGCAVIENVTNGKIAESRHENYKTLYSQLKYDYE
ncbi:putative ribosome biogenesis GTPase RsgA [Clostridia bacterium]|nr:putative ribosome biogenesis GTPase RsgA [Clostridia bacterium]